MKNAYPIAINHCRESKEQTANFFITTVTAVKKMVAKLIFSTNFQLNEMRF